MAAGKHLPEQTVARIVRVYEANVADYWPQVTAYDLAERFGVSFSAVQRTLKQHSALYRELSNAGILCGNAHSLAAWQRHKAARKSA